MVGKQREPDLCLPVIGTHKAGPQVGHKRSKTVFSRVIHPCNDSKSYHWQ